MTETTPNEEGTMAEEKKDHNAEQTGGEVEGERDHNTEQTEGGDPTGDREGADEKAAEE